MSVGPSYCHDSPLTSLHDRSAVEAVSIISALTAQMQSCIGRYLNYHAAKGAFPTILQQTWFSLTMPFHYYYSHRYTWSFRHKSMKSWNSRRSSATRRIGWWLAGFMIQYELRHVRLWLIGWQAAGLLYHVWILGGNESKYWSRAWAIIRSIYLSFTQADSHRSLERSSLSDPGTLAGAWS